MKTKYIIEFKAAYGWDEYVGDEPDYEGAVTYLKQLREDEPDTEFRLKKLEVTEAYLDV